MIQRTIIYKTHTGLSIQVNTRKVSVSQIKSLFSRLVTIIKVYLISLFQDGTSIPARDSLRKIIFLLKTELTGILTQDCVHSTTSRLVWMPLRTGTGLVQFGSLSEHWKVLSRFDDHFSPLHLFQITFLDLGPIL